MPHVSYHDAMSIQLCYLPNLNVHRAAQLRTHEWTTASEQVKVQNLKKTGKTAAWPDDGGQRRMFMACE